MVRILLKLDVLLTVVAVRCCSRDSIGCLLFIILRASLGTLHAIIGSLVRGCRIVQYLNGM